MTTLKLTIAYDGSKFDGSAIQPKKITVQGELEKALRVLGIKSKTVFSGRTDKDVHSTNQVVSFSIPPFWEDLEKLKLTLDKLLGNFIKVKSILRVSNDFHARFSAKKREYRYIISKKETNPFNVNYLFYHKNSDIFSLQEASKLFLGVHDFAYFSKMGSDPKSTIREIYSIKIYSYKDFIIFKFCANSYLRSQIRMMVSFLLKISEGKLTPLDLKEQLEKKAIHSKNLAPASGLYLTKIRYKNDD